MLKWILGGLSRGGNLPCSIPCCITAAGQVWSEEFAVQWHDVPTVSFCGCRWKLSHMSWTISCATSVRARAAAASSRPSSALTWRVCSITVNIAGLLSTPVPAGNSTSPWWRREGTARDIFHSAGTKGSLICRPPIKCTLLFSRLPSPPRPSLTACPFVVVCNLTIV